MVMTLVELVESLEGHDMAKMSPAEARQFRAVALERFRGASAALPELLLPDVTDLDRFAWTIEPANFELESIGRFSLIITDQIEANLGQPERVRMAAALFPTAVLIIDLMGDYHYPGGMSSFPALEINVRVMGEPGLSGLESMQLVASFSRSSNLSARRARSGFPVGDARSGRVQISGFSE
jgi:hypothetical protein